MIKYEESEKDGRRNLGMSSATGDTVAQLNSNYKVDFTGEPMPQGSSCFDYTTRTLYFFDGVSWS
ncbi:MAG: hypothetical protein E7290_09310 [Lachnospiraceae bacterium]|nr:hypothetical protein [Lachnospiraceae bacterium]